MFLHLCFLLFLFFSFINLFTTFLAVLSTGRHDLFIILSVIYFRQVFVVLC